MILRKDQLEASLHEEKRLIENGRLKEDSPLDLSERFHKLCEACRKGDLKACQELISAGANINARDQYDYTPLILASLCGHYDVVQLLLESGALCERDTFQGERCLYNALNDRIRSLLLSYDYSKSTNPLQPFASHITSLLNREHPNTADIVVVSTDRSFNLHKFVLSARSPYFRRRLASNPDTTSWKLPPTAPVQAFEIAIRYVYLGEIPSDVGGGPGTGFTTDEVLEGILKISKTLEIQSLWDGILESSDRRLARQNRTDEVEKGRNQFESWFQDNVLRHRIIVETTKADEIRWDRDNGIFADVLLRADSLEDDTIPNSSGIATPISSSLEPIGGIPIGPFSQSQPRASQRNSSRHSVVFPAHRAMLLRSEYFQTMFSSSFREAQHTPYLQVVPIDCSPAILEIILKFLYTEKADFPLELAVDVLFAADLLLIEKLKVKAAVVISTLGNGAIHSQGRQVVSQDTETEPDAIDIYEVIHAAWLLRVPRLEEFAARYFAFRLEQYIDEPEFAELIQESAARIKGRQETDSIELLDDMRFYLSERFRLRFENAGIEEMMDEAEGEDIDRNLVNEAALEVAEDQGVRVMPFSDNSTTLEPISQLMENQMLNGAVRTLDGDLAGDEFAGDAINYQVLLDKIDNLLDRLKLDA